MSRLYSDDQLHKVYSHLVYCAVSKQFCTYTELAELINIPTRGSYMSLVLGDLLGKIIEICTLREEPLLSSLCVRRSGTDAGMPGVGYFTCCENLGLIDHDKYPEVSKFWGAECSEIFNHYSL